jgi:hypothetical protein
MSKRSAFRLAPVACALGLLLPPPAAAEAAAQLLPPTPLVLKDGRIARVSVHTIPFPIGQDRPDAATEPLLMGLIDELATDCFLTAQAIGHVEPGPGSDGDTLTAHRLARARADGVQAALTARGLPAASIASVWDWQFAVRQPRVTLWVFRLAQGDDCEGHAIAQPEPALAAVAPPPPPEPPAQALPQPPDPPAAPQATELAAPEPPAPPLPAPGATVAEPSALEESLLALASPEAAVAPEAVPGSTADAAAGEPALAITFDVNSSFFPNGAGRELAAFAATLQGGKSYEIELAAAVSAEALRRPAADNGLAYNRWMAERRMSRVADWLRRHVDGGPVHIKQSYVENDESRRVTVRVRPLP